MGFGAGAFVPTQILSAQLASAYQDRANQDVLDRRLQASAPKGPQGARFNADVRPTATNAGQNAGFPVQRVPEIVVTSSSPAPRIGPTPFPELATPPLARIAPPPQPAPPVLRVATPQPAASPLAYLQAFASKYKLRQAVEQAAKDKLSSLGFAQTTAPNAAGKLEPEKCRVVCEKAKNNAKKQTKKKKRKKKVCLEAKDIAKAGLKTAFARLGLTPS